MSDPDVLEVALLTAYELGKEVGARNAAPIPQPPTTFCGYPIEWAERLINYAAIVEGEEIVLPHGAPSSLCDLLEHLKGMHG